MTRRRFLRDWRRASRLRRALLHSIRKSGASGGSCQMPWPVTQRLLDLATGRYQAAILAGKIGR